MRTQQQRDAWNQWFKKTYAERKNDPEYMARRRADWNRWYAANREKVCAEHRLRVPPTEQQRQRASERGKERWADPEYRARVMNQHAEYLARNPRNNTLRTQVRKEQNQALRTTATRLHYRWTPEEDAVILSSELTMVEKAALVSRSLRAVGHRLIALRGVS